MAAFDLVVIGDSFAEGRGGDRRPDGSFAGWVTEAARIMGIPENGVRNLGVFGATTQQVVDAQLPEALATRAPLTGLAAGGNDLVRYYDRDRFNRNLEHIVTSLAADGRTVFMHNYPDIPGHLPGIDDATLAVLRERFALANKFVAELALACGVLCLDMDDTPLTRDPVMWSPDGIHPSSAGHTAIGGAMAEMLLTAGVR